MAREVNRLSAKAVEKIAKPGYFCDGGGLYLQVSRGLTKSWIFRYSKNGRAREMGLGSYRDVTLAEAREKAEDARRKLANGIDPIDARDAAKLQDRAQEAAVITFAKCAEKYVDAHRAAWRNQKHAAQWVSTLTTYAGPVIGNVAVRDVDTNMVVQVLEPIWATKSETATRLRGRVERILDWARVRGYRAGENPARWRGHLDQLLPPPTKLKRVEHHAALPYEELPGFMRELRAQPGIAARALEFLILNASRTKEVTGATATELDLAKGLWTIPAARMKGGREHRVPLAARSIEIAAAQPAEGFLFPGRDPGKGLSDMAMLELLKRMGRSELTVHGFRSTFRDWAAECGSYPNEVAEMALAHAIGNKVEAAIPPRRPLREAATAHARLGGILRGGIRCHRPPAAFSQRALQCGAPSSAADTPGSVTGGCRPPVGRQSRARARRAFCRTLPLNRSKPTRTCCGRIRTSSVTEPVR